ncbi:MAG: beta-1,3-glucanase family protein [Spirochaetales bacterium]|nr:beta-1,3-glucanase family protein [Spirochaetales bacterium]
MKKAFLLFTVAALLSLTGCSSHSDSDGNTDPDFTIAVTEAQAVAEYDSLEAPKDSNYVSFIFENVTNGKFKNNEIFIVVLYQRGDGIYYWGLPDGTYKAVAANEYCTDYSYTIADDDGTDGRRVFNIPKNTNGARIFYSYGSKMSIHGPDNGVGVVFPSIANPNDPDYNKYYDWLEYTIREDGVTWVNTTQVDQFGFPALITAYASDGSVRSNGDNLFTQTGVAISRSEVYQKYYDYMESKGISSDFDCLAEKYRIVCPGKSSKFNKNYLDDYINEVWNYWTTHSTTVNHAQGKFTLTCDGTNLNFKCTESKNAGMCTVGETYSVHGKPTTEQAFEGSGCLATDTKGTGMEPALQAWVCAALNRHVATRSDNPAWGYTPAPAPASYNAAYYLEGKANYYSGFWHSISTNNGLAYGFCYDDVHEQSSTTVVNDCQKIWVRLGF